MKQFFISSALAFGVFAWMQLPAADNTSRVNACYPEKAVTVRDTVPKRTGDSIPGNRKYPDTTRPRRDSVLHQ